MPGEAVVAIAKLHWFIFIRAAFLLVLAIVFLSTINIFTEPITQWCLRIAGYGMLLLGIASALKTFIRHWTSEYAVTNKRVLVKVGLIRRDSLELLLAKVESIGVNQGIVGRLLGFGTLVITGTGGSANSYPLIASPLDFRRRVQEQIASVQDNR